MGVSVWGVSVQGRGSLSRGLCPGGGSLCPGGLCLGRPPSRGVSAYGGYLPRRVCLGGVSDQGDL